MFEGFFRSFKSNLAQYIALVVLVIVFLIWLFIHFIYNNPTAVFNGMLSQSLSMPGYTKQISYTSRLQLNNQLITVETGAKNLVTEKYTITSSKGQVTTLAVGTPYTDYSTYTSIKTSALSTTHKPLNYSSVLGIWAVYSPGGKSIPQGQLFNSAVVDLVPMANLNPSAKTQLLNYLNKYPAYAYSKTISHQTVNGKSVYVYSVKVNEQYLHNYLRQFAIYLGLKQYASTPSNDNSLAGAYAEFQFMINPINRQLVEIKSQSSDLKYIYSSYGASPNMSIPINTISLTKLDSIIRAIGEK